MVVLYILYASWMGSLPRKRWVGGYSNDNIAPEYTSMYVREGEAL